MKFGIAAFPSKELQDLANGYRKRYDPHYTRITPHMTLKNPFEANDQEIEIVAKAIKKIAQQHGPFELKIEKIHSFAPTTNTIYFKADPNQDLIALHHDLNTDNSGDKTSLTFIPHITVAQKLSSGEHDDIIGQLKMVGINHSEMIDRIHLLYQLEDGSWSTYETFRLERGH